MKRTLAAIVISCVGLTGCSYIDAITGAPKKMNNAEAAVKYLEIACPSNVKERERGKALDSAYKQIRANEITPRAYATRLDALLLQFADTIQKQSEELTDPDYVWPESVRSLTTEMSAAELEAVSVTREFLRNGGYKEIVAEQRKWPEDPSSKYRERVAEKASAIRSALRLPPRNEGCQNGKAGLTVEQMKKRQES